MNKEQLLIAIIEGADGTTIADQVKAVLLEGENYEMQNATAIQGAFTTIANLNFDLFSEEMRDFLTQTYENMEEYLDNAE